MTTTTVEHDGFRFLVRDDPGETGHTIPIKLPRLRNGFAVAVDVVVAVALSFVVRVLATVVVGAAVTAGLAFAQKDGGDEPAAVVMVVVGFLGICGLLIWMTVREYERLTRPRGGRRAVVAYKAGASR